MGRDPEYLAFLRARLAAPAGTGRTVADARREHAGDLARSPPGCTGPRGTARRRCWCTSTAVIATAEHDRLRPQAEASAARLRRAGVPVALVPGTGLDHGFLGWGSFARRPAEGVARIGAAVRRALT